MAKREKDLTIVFADLAGSTKLYETLGDQRALRVVADSLETLSCLVEERGGMVIKTIGDSILCTFSSVEKTAQAVSKMQDSLQKVSLSVRVGFHSGPVVEEEGDVFGNTVNIAARLVELAKPGQILTTKSTLEKLAHAYRENSRFVDRTTVKGLHEEFEIYELFGAGDASVRTLLIHPDDNGKDSSSVDQLMLRYQKRQVILSRKNGVVTLGREVTNDLIVSGDAVSRYHARLEYRRAKFVLVDQSANGTYIKPEGKNYFRVHRDEATLTGNGEISLGKPAAEGRGAILYSSQPGKKPS